MTSEPSGRQLVILFGDASGPHMTFPIILELALLFALVLRIIQPRLLAVRYFWT